MQKHCKFLGRLIKTNFLYWLVFSVGFTTIYYAVLLLTTAARFLTWPNFSKHYDFIESFRLVIQGTGAWSDIFMIMINEPMLEIGYLNTEYGIAEWSLMLLPFRVFVVFILGVLMSMIFLLLRHSRNHSCNIGSALSIGGTGLGVWFSGMSNITLTWVVCCSTPSWVVGLAMLGMSSRFALAIEPLGLLVNLIGFGFLFSIIAILTHSIVKVGATEGAVHT